jgi:Kef-type K+ transport system membrane component KefB
MLIGIISGPYILNMVSPQIIARLEFLESLALSFIALNAGGEFRLKQFASNRKGIIYILIFQIIVVFVGAGLAFWVIGKYLDFLSHVTNEIIFGFAILFATVSVSKSPATTIGIITELNAKGKTTDTILSVTILKSIVIVLIFPLLIGWAKMYLQVAETSNIDSILPAFYQILGSIITGLIVGLLTVFYLSKTREGVGLYLLGIALILAELSSLIGLEILLSSMIVGIVVQNFSKHGNSMIKGLELFSLPIYISFFFFTGARLHLDVVSGAILITLFLVIARMLLIYLGTFLGAKLANESKINKNYSWMGYIGQAGIALGLSVLIEKSFPGMIGESFIAIVIATVVINELIGPILFKYVLNKAKETNEEELFTNKYYSRVRRNNT